ncbi:hypothetical protein EEB14_40720 [Rhodococcus sp. WS4]|nr:hypothetical protein EEB14_40720 [Rhodococcus sp. WS4]
MASTDRVAACRIDERTEPQMNPLTVSSLGCQDLQGFVVAGYRVSDNRLTSTPRVTEIVDQCRSQPSMHVRTPQAGPR